MFADRAKIIIRSGKGGDGHVSFRRELYVPNGGPDGGDGGRGGDVIFEVDEGQNTLGEYRHKHKFKAQDGQEGGKKRCHGADGDDIILKVPEGTVIMEAQSHKVIADMSGENRRQIVLKGGRGGKGSGSGGFLCSQCLSAQEEETGRRAGTETRGKSGYSQDAGAEERQTCFGGVCCGNPKSGGIREREDREEESGSDRRQRCLRTGSRIRCGYEYYYDFYTGGRENRLSHDVKARGGGYHSRSHAGDPEKQRKRNNRIDTRKTGISRSL